jgi:DNA-binding MarR family transcriptional regulator
MNSGKGTGSENLMALLMRASQAFRADIDDHLRSTPGVPGVLRELNGGQRRLLTLIPATGARGTDLADRAGMSKQALGQLAAGLEDAGLIHAEPDRLDRRARIWKLSPAGTKAANAARTTLHAVETQWRARLGPRDYDKLASILTRILSDAATDHRHPSDAPKDLPTLH